jgi:hypothetical protein
MTTTTTTTTSTEQWLGDLGVTFVYEPDLDLGRIDVARSLTNQARIGEPVVGDVVERYTAAYQSGDEFPPLLARRTSARAKLVLLGGNHRHAAAKAAGLTTHPAYVVECTDEVALVLAFGDNRRHGLPPSNAERIAQAVHLIDQGMTQQDAAAVVGVQQSTISRHRTVVACTRRANTLGVAAEYQGLPMGHRERLALLRSDPVFVEATRLTVDAHLTQPKLNDLIGRLRNARSDVAALELLGTLREELADTIQTGKALSKKGKAPVTAYGTLNGALARILDVHADQVVPPDPASADRVRKKITETVRRLMDIDAALKAR